MIDKIAILGGTGTLGKSIIKSLLCERSNASILIFSRDEIKQLDLMECYPKSVYPNLKFRIGDVRDLDRLNKVIPGYDYVIHAAALKHVVMAEMNPEECYKTNVLGTKNVIEACMNWDVKKTLLISTDKAINPLGVYGKSKKEAESIFKVANEQSPGKFGVVRLGNIVGARGSVFESFEKQRKTGVLKVTHPEATRFCIKQDEAASFIIQSLRDSRSEFIQTPKMKAFKVIDLARKLAPECKIEITGLRPGDKLHEEINGVKSSEHLIHSTNIFI